MTKQQPDRFLKLHAADLPPEVTLRDLAAVLRRLQAEQVITDGVEGPLTEEDIPELTGGKDGGNPTD